MNLELLDIAVRGAASGIALIFIAIMWIKAAPPNIRIAFTLTILASLCRTWSSLPPGIDVPQDLLLVLKLLGATAMIFFTWVSILLFVDSRRHLPIWLGSAALVTLGLWINTVVPWMRDVTRAYALLHTAVLLAMVVLAQRDDLIDKRRQARLWIAVLLMIYVLFVALFSSPMAKETTVTVPLVQSILQFLVNGSFTLWAITLDKGSWVMANPAHPEQATKTKGAHALQVALMRRILAAMDKEIWRREGLSVADLAQDVGAPEHQVRKAINQELGYRNFSSFINQARISAVKQQLSDPDEQTTSVQEIAYSVGFSSIGPFNRAFRDETGQSPSEYRNTSLSSRLVDSEKTRRN